MGARLCRLVVAIMAAVAVFAAFARPASAADLNDDDAYGQYIVDQDSISFTAGDIEFGESAFFEGSGTSVTGWHARGNGTMTFFHDGRRLRAQLAGLAVSKVCGRDVWARFTYSDGSTSQRREEVCGRAPIDFDSFSTRDVVRAEMGGQGVVEVCHIDCGDPDVVEYSERHDYTGPRVYAGDSPDSDGTAARIDRDDLSIVGAGSSIVFNGNTTWSVSADQNPSNAIQSHVNGMLQWRDTLPGDRARLVVGWHYADGGSSVLRSAVVTAADTQEKINVQSNLLRQENGVWSVRQARQVVVYVETSRDGGRTWSAFPGEVMRNFGDMTNPGFG